MRIPNFWTAEILFKVAGKLGPIDDTFLKFNMSHFNHMNNGKKDSENISDTQSSSSSQFSVPRPHKIASIIRYTPGPSSLTNPSWIQELVPCAVVDEVMDEDTECVHPRQSS